MILTVPLATLDEKDERAYLKRELSRYYSERVTIRYTKNETITARVYLTRTKFVTLVFEVGSDDDYYIFRETT